MSAYKLQQQLAPAREAAQALNVHIAAIRQFLAAAGDGGRTALVVADHAAAELGQAQNIIARPLFAAGNVQTAMDSYSGLPTEAQIRQLDWAWEDAAAAVAMLNKLIRERMPAAYAAAGNAVSWPEVKPVAAPVRP
jgi:hypothetical protein